LYKAERFREAIDAAVAEIEAFRRASLESD